MPVESWPTFGLYPFTSSSFRTLNLLINTFFSVFSSKQEKEEEKQCNKDISLLCKYESKKLMNSPECRHDRKNSLQDIHKPNRQTQS